MYRNVDILTWAYHIRKFVWTTCSDQTSTWFQADIISLENNSKKKKKENWTYRSP